MVASMGILYIYRSSIFGPEVVLGLALHVVTVPLLELLPEGLHQRVVHSALIQTRLLVRGGR